jgi:hypothetical protein
MCNIEQSTDQGEEHTTFTYPPPVFCGPVISKRQQRAMPGLSGIDLAIQMRAQYPECKILLFSGHAATLDLFEDACNRGHDFHLLLKPVHPSKLLSEIGARLQDKAMANLRLAG